jgi:sulfur carrier protein
MNGEQASGAHEQKALQNAETSQAAAAEASTTLVIQVNGEPRRCGAGLTLVQVLEGLGYRPQLVVVEFNGTILPRQRWGTQAVVESDVLEVVTIVGGGS